MKQVALRLDDELAAAIDRACGDVPRERWIRGVLEAALRDLGRSGGGCASGASTVAVGGHPSVPLRASLGSPSSSLANFMPKSKASSSDDDPFLYGEATVEMDSEPRP